MNKERVKYYANNDLSIGMYLERLKVVMDAIDPSTHTLSDINDALELSNIVKFIDNHLFHRDWSQRYTDELQSKNSGMRGLIGKYFNNLNSNEIGKAIKLLDQEYHEDFIAYFSRYRLGNKVSEQEFKELLEDSGISIRDVMESKYLVEQYPDTVKEKFLAEPRNFETFLSKYTYSHSKKSLCLPKNITKEEMLILCDSYVSSDEANPNYLDILMTPIKGAEKHISIDVPMKLKIKKRIEEIQEKLFGDLSSGGGLRVGLAVFSSKEAYDKELEKSAPTDMTAYVDSEWLEEHHDYPTIWNNLQYLYELFSDDLISTMPSFPNKETGVVERLIGVKTENSYPIGQYFGLKHHLTAGKLQMVSELLSRYDIGLEDVIDWFFSTYSKEEFDIEWLPLNMPNKDENIGNKTATLFRIEESIRKQYAVLIANGSIDSEIVNIMNTPNFDSLPSFVENKYVYLSDDETSWSIVGLLYSGQSPIVHINKQREGHNFIDLITKHALKLADFHDYQKPRVQYLIDQRIIIVKEDDTLGYADIHELFVYKKLFAEGIVGYHHSSPEIQKAVETMRGKGRVTFKNSLYATQESDYLNFLLNNSLYDNSWAIRNLYQHGTPAYKNDSRYAFDYHMALLVLIHHVIKINDELSLRKTADCKEPVYSTL